MNCPICKKAMDYHTLLDAQLPAYRCPSCEGMWISSNEYLRWLRAQEAALPDRPVEEVELPIWEVSQLKLCPGCGHFLWRHKVFPNAAFYLDRCGHCNGVWFDKDEWAALVKLNMHDDINQFFTRPWQDRLREEEARSMLDQLYLERFGSEDYAWVKETWRWLHDHPQRSMMLAFLQAEEPYKI